MAYQALYRSYRPISFKDVVGQEHVIHTLKNAIKENRTSHAYVFSGLRGIGKTTIARILAKAVNCENPIDGEPCNCCACCNAINNGTTTDIIELDAASNNGVDQIREILEKVNYQPSLLRKKVYIIDEVHMLTTSAFNALLKTLEEPPKFVMFILATTEPHKIPATILSRCQRFDFKQLTLPELTHHLLEISNKENIKITDEALTAVAEAADGGMRDAISILDQTATYTDGNVTLDDVNNITGNVTNECLIKVVNDFNESNASQAITHINEIINNGKETSRVINGLIEFCRDLLLWIELNDKPTNKSIYQNPDFVLLASHSDVNRLFYYIDILNDTLNKIKFSTTPKIYLEVAIMKIVSNATAQVEVMTKIQELEEKINVVGNINNNYPTNYGEDYSGIIRSLQMDIQSIKVAVENNPLSNQVRLLEAKLNNQYYELLEKINAQPVVNQDNLFPNTFDEGTINEINHKLAGINDDLNNINNEIKLLKERNCLIQQQEEQNPLFSDFDQIENSTNSDVIELKKEIENIKANIDTLNDRIIELITDKGGDFEVEYEEETPVVEEENKKQEEQLETPLFDFSDEQDESKYPIIEEVDEPIVENPQEVPVEVTTEPIIEEQAEAIVDPIIENPQEVQTEEPIPVEVTTEPVIEEPVEVVANPIIENPQEVQTEEPTLEEIPTEPVFEEPVEEPIPAEVVVEPIVEEEAPTEKDITNEVYDVKVFEEILLEAMTQDCRLDSPFVKERWKSIKDMVGGKLMDVAEILSTGHIQANGINRLLIIFDTPQVCNLLMEPTKHNEAKEVIKYTYNKDYDFLALPNDTYEKSALDFKNLYRMGFYNGGLRHPKLKPFDNPALKVVLRDNKSSLSANDKKNKEINDFFEN